MNNERVHTHFSKLAEDGVWASLYRPNGRVDSETWSFLIRARRVVELLQRSGLQLRDVADVGCGTAPVARTVVAMGSRYTGLDFSTEMIESARENVADLVEKDSAEFRISEATKLSLPDSSYDAVLAMGVLEYLTLDSLGEALGEMRRVLRPNGVAVLTIPKRHDWGTVVSTALRPLRLILGHGIRRKGKLTRTVDFQRLYLTPGELDGACRAVGLVKVNQRHYNVQPVSKPFVYAAPRLSYLVNRPFEWMARLPLLTFFATGYIGMYRRKS